MAVLSASGFLRKVYGILTAQLGLTVLVVVVCLTVPQCKALVHGRLVRQHSHSQFCEVCTVCSSQPSVESGPTGGDNSHSHCPRL